MKIDIKNGDGLARQLSVEVSAENVTAELEKKYVELKKEVTLKGFRKGHAPMDVIRSQFADKVKAEVADTLLQQSLSEAVRDNNLRLATRPTITDMDFTSEGGFTYQADLEVFPEIEKVEFSSLKLAEVKPEIKDEEVDQMVKHYRQQASELRPLDRAATETDIVVADLEKLSDSKNALKEDSFPDSQIDLANPMTVKQFREELPGVSKGDEKEITIAYDDDYADPVFAGAKITYRCQIKSVNERILPELDDAFAKTTGMGETALEMRLKIREGLTRQKENDLRQSERQEIVTQMCSANDLLVPEGLLSEYLDSVVADMKEKDSETDEAEARERYRPVGKQSMQWDMLWRTLADQEKIEVLPEDSENWIKGFAGYNNITPEQAKESLQKSGKATQLRESLLEQKVLDFLTEKAERIPAKG